MNVEEVRTMFPALFKKIYNTDLVYLDNAATSQKTIDVIRRTDRMYLYMNGNIHRGLHYLSMRATEDYENTREVVRDFLNARFKEEIVFTSGTTASLNLLAFCVGETFIREGDEIILTEAEHHSNIVPWQMMCQRKNAKIVVWKLRDDCRLHIDDLKSLITKRTKLLSIAQVSNVLGFVNDIKTITQICHSQGVMVSVDAAQSVVHQSIDVQNLDCDFLSFSGHKIYAATGTGVLYGKKKILDLLCPYMGGGEMIEHVSFEKTTYASTPMKFEAGTQNYVGIITLMPALSFAKKIQNSMIVQEYHHELINYTLERLTNDDRINLIGGLPKYDGEKTGVFSITVKDTHHEDLALILDKMGIAVRSGQVCAEPLMDRLGITGVLRLSILPYNTKEDIDKFMVGLDRAIKMLK